jgi:hypothetical protein
MHNDIMDLYGSYLSERRFKSSCSGSYTPSPRVGGCWAGGDGSVNVGACSSLSLEVANRRSPAEGEDITGLSNPGGISGRFSAPLASGCSGSLSSATANEPSLDARPAITNMADSTAGYLAQRCLEGSILEVLLLLLRLETLRHTPGDTR